MDSACSMYGKTRSKGLLGIGIPRLSRRIILKCILEKYDKVV
jgi:hypothetical protein